MSEPEPLTPEARAVAESVEKLHEGYGDPAEVIQAFKRLPGNEVGGCLHLVLDDYNLDDEDLAWCSGLAFGVGDQIAMRLADALRTMSVYDRVLAVQRAAALP